MSVDYLPEVREYKLDPDLKAKWLKALRSGRYAQTKGRLHRKEDSAESDRPAGHCCLGVLCDIHPDVVEVPNDEADERGIATYRHLRGHEMYSHESTDVLPASFANEIGLSIGGTLNQPIVDRDTGVRYVSLWELNDTAGYTFAQIADVIEEQF